MRGVTLVAALALIAVVAGLAYQRGASDCRARYQARATLARTLEEKAHADPVAMPRCLGPQRLRRLNHLR